MLTPSSSARSSLAPRRRSSPKHWLGPDHASSDVQTHQELVVKVHSLELLIAEECRSRENECQELRRALAELKEDFSKVESSARAAESEQKLPTQDMDAVNAAAEVEQTADRELENTAKDAEEDEALVTARRLDLGDGFSLNESIWDVFTFVGHPCIGAGVSVVMTLAHLLNAGLQLYFCFIVFFYMLEEDIDSDVLTSLLRFRLGVGHNVEYADRIAQQSLAAQVCSMDTQLVLAGEQVERLGNMDTFLMGGKPLMLLVMVLWLCNILNEMNSTFCFARALANLKRSSHTTKLILTDSDSFEEHEHVDASKMAQALATLSVVARIKTISNGRLVMVYCFVIVPRLIVAAVLGYVGVRWLGKTTSMEDLVLNAVALAFVTELDELLYGIFVPRRAFALIHNLEPIPVRHFSRTRPPWLNCVLKMVLVAAAMVSIYMVLLTPFFWMLSQAHSVMCSGDQHFVFAQNVASGIVHVARTREESEWTEREKVVLTVAQPLLERKHGWDIGEDLLDLSRSSSSQAVVIPQADNIQEVEYNREYFRAIRLLGGSTLEESAKLLSCKDLSAGASERSTLEQLRHLMKDETLTSCDDVPWQPCVWHNMSQLRALCPMRCNCHKDPTYTWGYAGYFRTPAGGCPSQCATMSAAFSEIRYATGSVEQSKGHRGCEDIPPEQFIFHDSCVNTDRLQNPRVYNKEGFPCESIAAAHGGSPCNASYDDTDFTASAMCCQCGGGSTDVKTSLDCYDNMTDSCQNMELKAFWFLTWVIGLFEVQLADQFFADGVDTIVNHRSRIAGNTKESAQSLAAHVTSGEMARSLLSGQWNFMRGLPHPRGLKGCEYLTSIEFKALVDVDICSTDEYSSLKFLCPDSCGCQSTMYEDSGKNYTDVSDKFPAFSNRRPDLKDCPASCVLPHPEKTGDDAWSSWVPPQNVDS